MFAIIHTEMKKLKLWNNFHLLEVCNLCCNWIRLRNYSVAPLEGSVSKL